MLVTNRARAYVYAGDWVADCPRSCGNVEHVREPAGRGLPRTIRLHTMHCSYCKLVSEVDWPPDAGEILAVLERRPIPHNRNWYPSGHEVAVRAGLPHGQSVQDLIDESAEHGVI